MNGQWIASDIPPPTHTYLWCDEWPQLVHVVLQVHSPGCLGRVPVRLDALVVVGTPRTATPGGLVGGAALVTAGGGLLGLKEGGRGGRLWLVRRALLGGWCACHSGEQPLWPEGMGGRGRWSVYYHRRQGAAVEGLMRHEASGNVRGYELRQQAEATLEQFISPRTACSLPVAVQLDRS